MKDNGSTRELSIHRDHAGFTLIEIVIGMAISAVVLMTVFNVYNRMQNSSVQQVEINMLQQNQRGVLSILERELRLIGMDMNQVKKFKVTDVRKYAITEPAVDATLDGSPTGSPVLRMTLDLNDNGILDGNETITYSLFDRDGDGQPPYELARSTVNPGDGLISGRVFLADGIEAIGFAYAFDADDDGRIDRAVLVAGQPASIIWGVDTDNDGRLDADLSGAPLPIGGTVPSSAIRAVQFWILGRAQRPDPAIINNHQYSVGNQVIGPANDHFRRWLLSEIIHCRNL